MLLSASSNHFCSSGFSLHMFLKLRLSASNRDMVVCEKSLPYSFPIAKPTSPCVKPSFILRCLKVLANCSSSSRSVVSSGDGSRARGTDGSFCICGVCVPEPGVEGVSIPPTLSCATFGGVVWFEPTRIEVGVGKPGLPAGLCSGELAIAEVVWFLICCCFWSACSCCAACATYKNNISDFVLHNIFKMLLYSAYPKQCKTENNFGQFNVCSQGNYD